MIDPNNSQSTESPNSLISKLTAGSGVGAFAIAVWQGIESHSWWSIGLGFLGFILIVGPHRSTFRAWIIKKLQTAEMVGRYERTLVALKFRGEVLGVVADFSKWTSEFIMVTQQSGDLRFFDRLNEAFIDACRDLFPGVERIALFTPDASGNDLRIAYGTRFTPGRTESLRLPITHSAAGQAYTSGKSFFSENLPEENNSSYNHLPGSREIKTLLCVPVRTGNTTHCVLSMDSRSPKALDLDMIEVIEMLCANVAVAWLLRNIVANRGDVV